MLQLKEIRKKYVTGELEQTALDGVSLNLRESELVAILGPSGSGKSTLLNVIGGLDQYDSGDLIIDGISTKEYKSRDWDSYRNHTVGFVFQSYNLIPHQTVLANVELALTISGVSRKERKKRAARALEEVGLGNQLHKKPSQMSGGQMQRVAIARALVNNPGIVLADEPTGALDSETSVQVMELLKQVSKDRLVVMVTHNPELAERYADRIVRVKDGSIVDDTNPYEPEKEPPRPVHKTMGKTSMSFFSALSLSFNNLKSKKGRTFLTAFAGSIGIIGIALIMSLSAGFQKYIDRVQDDMLANNPLTIQAETADIAQLVMPDSSGEPGQSTGTVQEQPVLTNMFEHFGTNDLSAFRQHLDDHYDEIGHTMSTVQYGYGVDPQIYVTNKKGVQQVNPSNLFKRITGNDLISAVMDVDAFHEIVDSEDLLQSQYQVLEGRWPEAWNEVIFVLPAADQISDHVAYNLGMKDLDSLEKMVNLLMDGKEAEPSGKPMEWTYDDLMNMTFTLVSRPDLYRYNGEFGIWEDMSQDEAFVKDVVKDGEELKVVGVVCPRPGTGGSLLSSGIGYTRDLTLRMMEKAGKSRIVRDQLTHPDIDVFSGKTFGEVSTESLNFENLITIDRDAISEAFGIDINESAMADLMEKYLEKIANSIDVDTSAARADFLQLLSDFSRQMLTEYLEANADEEGLVSMNIEEAGSVADAFLQSDYAQGEMDRVAQAYGLTPDSFQKVLKPLLVGLITGNAHAEGEDLPVRSTDGLPEEEETEAAPALLATENVPGTEPETESVQFMDASETEAAAVPAMRSPETVPGEETETEETENGTEAPTEGTEVPDVPEPPEETWVFTYSEEILDSLIEGYLKTPVVTGAASVMGQKMMQDAIMEAVSAQLAGFGDLLTGFIGSSFYIDEKKLASAFQFNMTEDEMRRIVEAMSQKTQKRSADTNLRSLGWGDPDCPTEMAFYLKDFEGKEEFVDFLEDYNQKMRDEDKEMQVLQYTDMAGMMMSSVRSIIDSVSYVLIALVAVSLLVSSIMIGIITYISVMERTKEIGILRAMGASKRNISQVFNAETFIIGLISGVLGIVITLLLLIPGNELIHLIIGRQVTASLPIAAAGILILLSMVLTLLGGLIPAKQAAKKDPVQALRSE